ncbi:hypothetical protein RJ641_002048 [Dillenia turbinata]|uniref:Uncharacterized protein n=1 Tax=Dillenia turbinata TaxID=194707 RepID=A0AAN8VFA3_9MAGN
MVIGNLRINHNILLFCDGYDRNLTIGGSISSPLSSPEKPLFASPNFLRHDLAEYNFPSYESAYDHIPNQFSSRYSFYDAYDSSSCSGAHDYSEPTQSFLSYSVANYGRPKHLVYDPEFHGGVYSPEVTQYVISYSVAEFNEPEFEEYDPTPYGGGYDPKTTYGSPLPPSDEICYPRSTPGANGVSLDGVLLGPANVPSGEEESGKDVAKHGDGIVPTESIESDEVVPKKGNGVEPGRPNEEEKQVIVSGGDGNEIALGDDDHTGESLDSAEEKEYYPNWSGREGDYGNETREWERESYGYDCGDNRGNNQEGMTLCDQFFGYWPCLSKGYGWNGAADYLFGSSCGHGEEPRYEAGIYENPIFGYERHYWEEPQSVQVQYEENTWVQDYRYCEERD